MGAAAKTVYLPKREGARHDLDRRQGGIDVVKVAPVLALNRCPIHPLPTGQIPNYYTPVTRMCRSRKSPNWTKRPHLLFHLPFPTQFSSHREFPNSAPRPGHVGCPFHLPILHFSRSIASTPWGTLDLGRPRLPRTSTSINRVSSTHRSKDTPRPLHHGARSMLSNVEEDTVDTCIKGHQLRLSSSYNTKIAIRDLMTMGELKGERLDPEGGGKPSVHAYCANKFQCQLLLYQKCAYLGLSPLP
jgi:hypothetical protein